MADDVRTARSSGRPALSMDEYFDGVRRGDMAVLARALTLIESSKPQHQRLAEQLLDRLLPFTGGSIRIGVTGVPGAGKSTFIESLGLRLAAEGRRIAVLAIDPSSDLTGGSILGDKTRMPRLGLEPNVYIRPSPASGTLGGAALRSRECMLICEAAGYDVVLIETVGVGQSESYVAHMTDCLLALMLPHAGDELQAIKKGLLEFVHLLVVNKADGDMRKGCEIAAQQYRSALELFSGQASEMAPKVFLCSAQQDEGIDAIWSEIASRHERAQADGSLAAVRREQNRHWLWNLVERGLKQQLESNPKISAVRADIEQEVLDGKTSVESAVRRILEACDFV